MGDYKSDRPIFCGNFEYDAAERDIEKLFEKYGRVDKIDMKTGFAFIYMRDKRDADDAIRRLDGETFGYKRRRLRVEYATHPEEPKRDNVKPKTTLFIVNFDVRRTRERDLERYFSKWGRLVRTEIKKNYAFVQYERLSDAEDAQREAHNREFMDRRLSVEYVANEDPHAAFGRGRSPPPRRSRSRSPRRQRSRSPAYGRRGRSRSASPRARSPSPKRRSYSESPRRRRSISPVRRSPSPRARSRSPYTRRSRSP